MAYTLESDPVYHDGCGFPARTRYTSIGDSTVGIVRRKLSALRDSFLSVRLGDLVVERNKCDFS